MGPLLRIRGNRLKRVPTVMEINAQMYRVFTISCSTCICWSKRDMSWWGKVCLSKWSMEAWCIVIHIQYVNQYEHIQAWSSSRIECFSVEWVLSQNPESDWDTDNPLLQADYWTLTPKRWADCFYSVPEKNLVGGSGHETTGHPTATCAIWHFGS